MALAILASHPVQYYAPFFRAIAQRFETTVFYAHRATPAQQAAAGFGTAFDWDVDLLAGYRSLFLRNVARDPGAHHFAGCDTPEIGRRLSMARFDALLVMGWHLKSFWQGVLAAKRGGIAVLARGDSQLGAARSRATLAAKSAIYPLMLRAFDAALYVGQRNRAYYEHYRFPAGRLFASPHCVDTERFARDATSTARHALRARLGMAPDDRAALFAGRLVAFKRPADLIDAAAIVRGVGLPLHVVIAGSGPLEAVIRARAEALRVPLHVLGFQNQTLMPAAYAAADALVLPSSERETWGLVCNEALASGTPIIVSSAVGCAPDLASDENVGRIYPCGDARALAKALAATLCSPPPPRSIRDVSDRFAPGLAADGVAAAMRAVARRLSGRDARAESAQ
jgi:glycosyltransferase involved in cell wall biosynthesis